MADQYRTSAGFLLFPDSRFQPMSEYSAIILRRRHSGYDLRRARSRR